MLLAIGGVPVCNLPEDLLRSAVITIESKIADALDADAA